jgi:hypothetical protein
LPELETPEAPPDAANPSVDTAPDVTAVFENSKAFPASLVPVLLEVVTDVDKSPTVEAELFVTLVVPVAD